MMIILFTDFGIGSPYQAQLQAALYAQDASQPIIDLHADLACYQIQPAAYLLAAYLPHFPVGSVFVCVVDPGVGGARRPLVLECAGRWLVGPDNGLFAVLAQHFSDLRYWEIVWRPQKLSNTFHGRDLFAPIAARISRADFSGLRSIAPPDDAVNHAVSADAWQIIYQDHYGNLYTGIRASQVDKNARLALNGQLLAWAKTYSEVPQNTGFFYENSIGLVEIALNQGNAAQAFAAQIGNEVKLLTLCSF